jgi:hypothetical protein
MNHADYPALYQSASALSKRKQEVFYENFYTHMALLALASAISVANSTCPAVAVVQALVLLGALACATYLFMARPDRDWYASRAVAESVKTITWRYISRAEPFNNTDECDRIEFKKKLKSILDQNQDVAGLFTSNLAGVQITDEMEVRRSGQLPARIDFYKSRRIVEQQNWYASKAEQNERSVNRFFLLLLSTIAIAIIFSLLKILYPSAPYWPTDFFVTCAAGFLSWIQAKRFQDLSISYALAAHEISLIREELINFQSETRFSAFVSDAENAFSREHTQWAARKDH